MVFVLHRHVSVDSIDELSKHIIRRLDSVVKEEDSIDDIQDSIIEIVEGAYEEDSSETLENDNDENVEEIELDAVTAVSGREPAYVFEFCAALREAGVQAGLDSALSNDLAIQTLLGASKLLAQSDHSAEDLRNAVTSPGGTTAAALKAFSDADLRGIVARAIESAKARSIELGQG